MRSRAAGRRSSSDAAPSPSRSRFSATIAATDEEAVEVLWPHMQAMYDRIGRERGWPPTTRARFEAEVAEGAWHVGAPETVARKIARTVQVLDADRFDMKYSAGTLPHDR